MNSYFNTFMGDIVRELKEKGTAFVFNDEQVDYAKEKFENLIVKENDGIFCLTVERRKKNDN